ncbi:MAG: transcription antitermination factor NusB [Oscillospiraceae bacterium]|nr:transcription antitermination factor NusB [Oscillospiraceae bacterium]
MSRKGSRELAMRLLYQTDVQRGDRAFQIEWALGESCDDEEDRAYVTDVLDGVEGRMAEIDGLIGDHAKGWKTSRMSKVDLAIIRLGLYEILGREDIPVNVTMNEAVELAKRYGGDESASFVNGVLGGIYETLERRAAPAPDAP